MTSSQNTNQHKDKLGDHVDDGPTYSDNTGGQKSGYERHDHVKWSREDMQCYVYLECASDKNIWGYVVSWTNKFGVC